MNNFAFFMNHQLSSMPQDRLDELKKVFPKFFGAKREPIYLRASDANFHPVKTGSTSNRMKKVNRPNAPITVVMRAQDKDPQTLRLNEVVIASTAPEFNPLTNRANYKKSAHISLRHGLDVHDENVLYYLYFLSGLISNGKAGEQAAPFEIVMPEQESAKKLLDETRIAEFVVKVSKLENSSVVEIMAKYGLKASETDEINKNGLIAKFKQSNADTQDNLNMFADAILSEGSKEKKESVDNVQAAVESAIESGVIKIESGAVYLRKMGSEEYQKNSVLKLTREDADEKVLEIVEYFTANQDKLKFIK